MQSTSRSYFELCRTGDLVVEGKAMSVKIDSYRLTSASSAFKDGLKDVARKSPRTKILTVSLPDGIPDDALRCLLVLVYPDAFGQTTLSTEREWALALALAIKWELAPIRSLAMSALDGILGLSIDRAVAGAILGVQEWETKGVADLTKDIMPMGLTINDMTAVLQKKRDEMSRDLGLGSSSRG